MFQDAVQVSEENNLKPKLIAKAYWNLGLAYEYSWQFYKSINAFDAAYDLQDDATYLAEKSNVKKLMASREKLLRQMRALATSE